MNQGFRILPHPICEDGESPKLFIISKGFLPPIGVKLELIWDVIIIIMHSNSWQKKCQINF
jgi:hypothetical protein